MGGQMLGCKGSVTNLSAVYRLSQQHRTGKCGRAPPQGSSSGSWAFWLT
jgi:hypothetical protein